MKDFKYYIEIKAEPQDVYTALTNPFTIELWSGEEAVMSTEPDTEFSIWGGYIVGKNLAFEPNKLIQQEWYFGEEIDAEPSIVTIKIWPKKTHSSVELLHTNIPSEAYENIVEGWKEAYLGAVKKLLEI